MGPAPAAPACEGLSGRRVSRSEVSRSEVIDLVACAQSDVAWDSRLAWVVSG